MSRWALKPKTAVIHSHFLDTSITSPNAALGKTPSSLFLWSSYWSLGFVLLWFSHACFWADFSTVKLFALNFSTHLFLILTASKTRPSSLELNVNRNLFSESVVSADTQTYFLPNSDPWN